MQVLLAGDVKQLSPFSASEQAEVLVAESLLAKLIAMKFPYSPLTLQYRMHPKISAFVSSKFYQGELLDAPDIAEQTSIPLHEQGPAFGPLTLFSVPHGTQSHAENSTSCVNKEEADFIKELLSGKGEP